MKVPEGWAICERGPKDGMTMLVKPGARETRIGNGGAVTWLYRLTDRIRDGMTVYEFVDGSARKRELRNCPK